MKAFSLISSRMRLTQVCRPYTGTLRKSRVRASRAFRLPEQQLRPFLQTGGPLILDSMGTPRRGKPQELQGMSGSFARIVRDLARLGLAIRYLAGATTPLSSRGMSVGPGYENSRERATAKLNLQVKQTQMKPCFL